MHGQSQSHSRNVLCPANAQEASCWQAYRQYLEQHGSPFIELPNSQPTAVVAERHCYRPHRSLGQGWMDWHRFHNGLMLGRMQCHFHAACEQTWREFPDNVRVCVLLGNGFRLDTQGQTLYAKPGDVIVRNGDIGHLSHYTAADCLHSSVALDVPRTLVQTLTEQGTDLSHWGAPGSLVLLRPSAAQAQALEKTARRMLTVQMARQPLLAALELESLGIDVLLQVLASGGTAICPISMMPLHKGYPATSATRSLHWQRAIDLALDIIHTEWRHPLSIAQLARRAGINECYLKALFKQRTGQSVGSYQRQLRMQHAREMLQHQGLPVQAVAHACGYARADKFSQAFERHFGIKPSQWD